MFRSFIYFFFVCILFSQTFSGDNLSEIKNNKFGKITVLYRHAVPMAYMDGDQMKGIEAEIFLHFIHYVQKKLNVKIEINWVKKGEFKEFYNLVKDSKNGVFGLGSVSIKESRKKDLNFSPSYIENFPIILSHASFPDLTSLSNISKDFSGKKAIVVQNTTNDKLMEDVGKKYFSNLIIERNETNEGVIKKLAANSSIYFTYLDLVKSWPMIVGKNIKRHPAGDGKLGSYGFIMPKSSDWNPIFIEFFEAGKGYRSSRPYLNLIKKYYGQEFVNILKMLKTAKN